MPTTHHQISGSESPPLSPSLKPSSPSSLPQIVVIRHGERADKYPELKSQQEPENPSLTEAGFVQALGIGEVIRKQYHHEDSSTNNEKTKNKNNSNRKWKIISSPFLRTLQTASAIMTSLGEERCASSTVEIDFDCGERLKVSEVPKGVVDLTEEKATKIVQEGHQFSLEKRKGLLLSLGTTANNNNNNEKQQGAFCSPISAKFGHGDATHIHPQEKLEAGGLRVYRAIERLYAKHLMNSFQQQTQQEEDEEQQNQNQKEEEQLPNLLIVSHGYAPSQLLKIIYGRSAVDATRVFLCAAICLQPFDGLADRTQKMILKAASACSSQPGSHSVSQNSGKPFYNSPTSAAAENNTMSCDHTTTNNNNINNNDTTSDDAISHQSESGDIICAQEKPKFTVLWTRGVKWRIPPGQPRILSTKAASLLSSSPSAALKFEHVTPSNSISNIGESNNFEHTNENDDDDLHMDLSSESNNTNKDAACGGAGVSDDALRFTLSQDQDRIFHNSPFANSAEEPDVHGTIEKVWYESKAVNIAKPEKYYLGFELAAESAPPLVPLLNQPG